MKSDTLAWDQTISIGGTSLQGYLVTPWSFEETVARLITLCGPPRPGDEYKISVEFTGTFNGQVFSLYDYKGDRELHIGGHKKLPGLVETICAALQDVKPTPYTATEHYDTRSSHGWKG